MKYPAVLAFAESDLYFAKEYESFCWQEYTECDRIRV